MSLPLDEIPREVAAAYSIEGAVIEPSHSLINRTFIVGLKGTKLVLQRLHPVFGAEVHHDIVAITRRLAVLGVETPRLVPTHDGDLWCTSADGGIWRAQTFIDGGVFQAVQTPEQAASAAQLVARFHRALSGFEYAFAHVRAGAHDTAKHLERLEAALRQASSNDQAAKALGLEILVLAEGARLDFSELPRRICHGDLKISNVLFFKDHPEEARCLIDLDTLGYQLIAHELGDALRSWCNPGDESHTEPQVDQALFGAALRGYAIGAPGLLAEREVESLVTGLETISVELAARFCIDIFEDRYFGFDATRFASRRDHNFARARAQLALGKSVRRQRGDLERIAIRSFAEH